MTRCPECGDAFAPGVDRCPRDGSRLLAETRVEAHGSGPEAATALALSPSAAPALDADDTLAAGTVVGEWIVERLIGAGGMGRVYLARHPVLAKAAAVKVLRAAHSRDPVQLERFVQEARTLSRLGHAGIVGAFGFGALPDGRRYFLMEALDGESLAERIARGPVPVVEAIEVLRATAAALAAAHAQGIVHRDLKPENIYLARGAGPRPDVKLLDFGVAKLVSDDDNPVARTATGNIVGTPLYLSPEQARGDAVGPAADVYALGAVAFETLCGRPPFTAATAVAVISEHLHLAPPEVRSIRPEVPSGLAALVRRMLAKEPGARPPLDEVRRRLDAPPGRGWGRVVVAGVAVAGALVLGVWAALGGAPRDVAPAAGSQPVVTVDAQSVAPAVVVDAAPSPVTVDAAPAPAPAPAPPSSAPRNRPRPPRPDASVASPPPPPRPDASPPPVRPPPPDDDALSNPFE